MQKKTPVTVKFTIKNNAKTQANISITSIY